MRVSNGLIHIHKTHKRLAYTPKTYKLTYRKDTAKKETSIYLGHQGCLENKPGELPHGPKLFQVLEKKKMVSGLDSETPAFQLAVPQACRTPEEDPSGRLFGRNLPSIVE